MGRRVEINRAEVLRLMRRQPFRPFYIGLESGDRLDIEHPENIAFDPTGNDGDGEFHMISRKSPGREHLRRCDCCWRQGRGGAR